MLGGVFVFETKVLLCSLNQTASILRQSPQSRDSGRAPPGLAVDPAFYALLFLLSHSLPFQILPTSHRTHRILVFCYYTLGMEITTSPCIGITWYGHGYRTHLQVGFLHQRVSEFMTVTPPRDPPFHTLFSFPQQHTWVPSDHMCARRKKS